jgi:hypothetical protein
MKTASPSTTTRRNSQQLDHSAASTTTGRDCMTATIDMNDTAETKTVSEREDELVKKLRRLRTEAGGYDHYLLHRLCGSYDRYFIISRSEQTREDEDFGPGSIMGDEPDAYTLTSTYVLTLEEAEEWVRIEQEAADIYDLVVQVLKHRADAPFLAWRHTDNPADVARSTAVPLDNLFPAVTDKTDAASRHDHALRNRVFKMLQDLPYGWRLTKDAEGVPYFIRDVVGYPDGDAAWFAQEPR